LFFCFYLKKNAAESQRMLLEVYSDDYIHRFQHVTDFDATKKVILTEGKEHPGQPKKFEDEETLQSIFESNAKRTCRIIKC